MERGASNVNRFCLFSWFAQSLPGRATPVSGGRAVLCCALWSIFGPLWCCCVLVVPLVLVANNGWARRTGFAATVPSARGRQAAAWNGLAPFGEQYVSGLKDTHPPNIQALVLKVPETKVEGFCDWCTRAPAGIPLVQCAKSKSQDRGGDTRQRQKAKTRKSIGQPAASSSGRSIKVL